MIIGMEMLSSIINQIHIFYYPYFFHDSTQSSLIVFSWILYMQTSDGYKSTLLTKSVLDDLLIVILHFAEKDTQRTIGLRFLLFFKTEKKSSE